VACQLLTEHDAGGNLATARDNMEVTVTNETYQIQHENVTYQAAICHRCGAKMFPVELLEAHMDRHQLKDMYLESELKKLQYSMNRMR
jgi:ribosomal protein S27AE